MTITYLTELLINNALIQSSWTLEVGGLWPKGEEGTQRRSSLCPFWGEIRARWWETKNNWGHRPCADRLTTRGTFNSFPPCPLFLFLLSHCPNTLPKLPTSWPIQQFKGEGPFWFGFSSIWPSYCSHLTIQYFYIDKYSLEEEKKPSASSTASVAQLELAMVCFALMDSSNQGLHWKVSPVKVLKSTGIALEPW